MRRSRAVLVVLALVLWIPTAMRGAETGSISGRVLAADGAPLAAVTVTVRGDLLPAGRSVTSRADGGYTLLRLSPGTYTVVADLGEAGGAERTVVVAVDRDTQVDLLVAPRTGEEITVEVARPRIDVRSARTAVSFGSAQIEALPIAHDYKGLFQLAPGVAEIPSTRTAPNAGGSRMDNTFLLDGVNITNPHYGDVVPDVEGLDVEEVDLERAGITAELGRTGGMVVNAVTRRGTNELSGRARFDLRPATWNAAPDHSVAQSVDRREAAAALGGPLLRDRAWFYASGGFPRNDTTERSNQLGALPDLEVRTSETFLKLSAAPVGALLLDASLRRRDTTTDNDGMLANVHPSAGTDVSTRYRIGTLLGTWALGASSLVEGRFNSDSERSSSEPLTDLGYRPLFDPAHPERAGRFTTAPGLVVGGATAVGQVVGGTDLAVNDQDFRRDEARLAGQTLRTWHGRSHDLRAGVAWERAEERLERRANGWGNIAYNTTTQTFTATYVPQQPPHTGRSRTGGAFVQDQVTLGARATLLLGVLANRDVYYGERFTASGGKTKAEILAFDWRDQIQPRLGLTFVPTPALGDRLYLAAGRYSNSENKSLTRAASPTRIYSSRATFDREGVLLSDVAAANTQSKTIDAGLAPMHTDELSGGYARPLGRAWTIELSAIRREVGDIYEDVSADGLGNGPFHVAQLPGAYRRYEAATLQVRRTPVDGNPRGLWLDASYTWSRLRGNWDIDYANSLFANSSIIQDGPGVLITDHRDGLLRGDHTHVAKLFATLSPVDHLHTGAYLRYQSGGAWEARGQPSSNVTSGYYRYLERAGSRRTPDWWNVDLLLGYDLRLGSTDVALEGRVLNVFDRQVALEVDDRYLLNQPMAAVIPAESNNPTFGQGTVFSPPRAFQLTATLRF